MTQDHATEAPVCYRHPNRHTLLRCSRCERPICASCSIDATVGQRCPECVRNEGPQKIIPRQQALSRTGGAPATKAFIAIAVIFWVLASFGGMREVLYENLAQVNVLVAQGEWWRIFTPVFLHSPGFMHIMFNMWALWVLGPQIERGVGTWPFVGLYFASAGVGGLFMYLIGGPESTVVAVGASGAIFGLFGVWLNFAIRQRNTLQGKFLLRQIGVLLLLNAALPFILRGIAWEAHLGGLIAGFVIGELWARVKGSNTNAIRVAITVAVAAFSAIAVMIL